MFLLNIYSNANKYLTILQNASAFCKTSAFWNGSTFRYALFDRTETIKNLFQTGISYITFPMMSMCEWLSRNTLLSESRLGLRYSDRQQNCERIKCQSRRRTNDTNWGFRFFQTSWQELEIKTIYRTAELALMMEWNASREDESVSQCRRHGNITSRSTTKDLFIMKFFVRCNFISLL